jgi:integrase
MINPQGPQAKKEIVKRNRGGDGLYHRKGRGWYAVVEFAKKAGKRDRRWYGPFDTSESAKCERDKRRNEARQGVDLDPRKTTFGEFLARWLTYQETKPTPVAPRTIGGYKSIVETRLRPGLGHLKLSQVTALRFAEMVASWSKGKRLDGKKGTINSRSVAANVRVLRMVLKQAARWRLISHELAASVEAPRVERANAVFVQVSDVPALTAAARETKLYAPVATCLGLGLRRGELLGLQWRDVDLEQGVIRIERALQRIEHKLVTAPPKTKLSARVLTAPRFVLDALREYRASILAARMNAGLGKLPETHFVFGNPNGGPLDPDSFGKRFVRVMKDAGLDVHLHSLRHGYAVLNLEAGTDLKVVSSNMGHSSIRLTADTYSHLTATLQRDAADRFDALLDGAQNRANRSVG